MMKISLYIFFVLLIGLTISCTDTSKKKTVKQEAKKEIKTTPPPQSTDATTPSNTGTLADGKATSKVPIEVRDTVSTYKEQDPNSKKMWAENPVLSSQLREMLVASESGAWDKTIKYYYRPFFEQTMKGGSFKSMDEAFVFFKENWQKSRDNFVSKNIFTEYEYGDMRNIYQKNNDIVHCVDIKSFLYKDYYLDYSFLHKYLAFSKDGGKNWSFLSLVGSKENTRKMLLNEYPANVVDKMMAEWVEQ